jgi:hypothetical protein
LNVLLFAAFSFEACALTGQFRKHPRRHTDRAPTPSIQESQAVKAGPYVFLSQLLATDYKTGIPAAARVNPNFPNHDSDVRRQLGFIFETADTILTAAGSSIKKSLNGRVSIQLSTISWGRRGI